MGVRVKQTLSTSVNRSAARASCDSHPTSFVCEIAALVAGIAERTVANGY